MCREAAGDIRSIKADRQRTDRGEIEDILIGDCVMDRMRTPNYLGRRSSNLITHRNREAIISM